MKTKLYFLLVALFISMNGIYAQTIIKASEVDIVNLGDNQMYIHYQGDKNKPVDGKVRIIDGRVSEYIDFNLKKGYPNGEGEIYRDNRLINTLSFKNGYPDGKATSYFPDGSIEKILSFKEGKKNGECITYNRPSEYNEHLPSERSIYENDFLVKLETYFLDGSLEKEINMKNGKQDGFERVYDHKAELISERFFVDGKPSGREQVCVSSNVGNYLKICYYNENGHLDGEYSEEWIETKLPKNKGVYIDGNKEGKWSEWSEDGKIRRIKTYKDGADIEILEISHHD